MSKGNIFMGQSRGKLGDIVQYRAGGQQRQRGYNSTNGSKSYGQQAQRSRLKSAYNLYKTMQALVASGFAKGTVETSPYNRYMSENMPIAPYLRKPLADEGKIIIFPAVLAKGSLVRIHDDIQYDATDGVAVGMDYLTTTMSTVGAISAAILAKFPCLAGRNVSMVAGCVKVTSPDDEGAGLPNTVVKVVELDPNSTTTLTAAGLSFADGHLSFSSTAASGNAAGFFFIIAKDGDKVVDASNSDIKLSTDAATDYAASITEAAAKAAAESYGAQGAGCGI